jgi:hypothetical protein
MAVPPTDPRSFLLFSSNHAQWSIQLADTKSSVLMAASALLAGLLVQQTVPACSPEARDVLFLAVGLALATAGACLLALFPRTLPVTRSSLNHYVAITRFPDAASFLAKVQGLAPADMDREFALQVWEQARIQAVKFTWLRWASRLFAVCLAATLVGTVWAHLPCG